MKLSDWLKQEKMTQAQFAELIGSDQGHVSDLVRGKMRPRLENVVRIEKSTRGAVTAADWVEQKSKRVRLDRLKAAVRKAAR